MDLRVGLIGYGSWTRMAYIPALQRDGRAQIVSAAAPSAATQQRIASELGPDISVYSNAAELLSGPPVDAVFIAVSDAAHEEALTSALDARLPIFYEPPLSNRRQRIRPMVTKLLNAPQVTHADLEIGFIPVFVEAARRVRDGVIGQVHSASVRLQSSWGADPEADLSTLNHIAPWYVDTLNRILDATPSRVLILEGEGLPGRAQRQCQGLYDYGGTWGTVQVNLDCVVELETTVEVNGEDGDLIFNLFSGELRQRTRSQPDWTVESVAESEPRAGWPGMNECVATFLDAVTDEPLAETTSTASPVDSLRDSLGTAPPPADANSVAQLHLIGLAAEASKDSGGWAKIEEIDPL
ncbi:MAG: Gfo/Idh/MocA family oxidoreductase [Caldilineaceae bacterium]|nr:Gfo/Idh/MocA family oxidoreductase [Caldilineaceae bacterium]